MLAFYNYCFTLFHSAFILFVLFGWIHPKTRKAHYLAILLTIIAWLILGLRVGTLGYCPLTDWQWEIKNQLGYRGLPNSFTEYVLEKILQFLQHLQNVAEFSQKLLIFQTDFLLKF